MKYLVFVCVCIVLFSCTTTDVVSDHGRLQVEGNKIVGKDGAVVSLAGMSFYWAINGWPGEKYYEENTVNYLAKEWNSNIVRAAIGIDEGGGYVDDPQGNLAKAERIVDAAIKNDIYAIVDFHSHHGEDYEAYAHRFFDSLSRKYGNTDHIIYEIYNEPLNISWDTILKPFSERVIETIRKNDPDNLILVGTPNWSQDVDVVVGNEINDDNVAYVLHFYAATHKEGLRQKAKFALDAGIALFVSEWGSIQASGDGDIDEESVEEWMKFMKTYGLSHCNWSVCDKAEGASIFSPDVGLMVNYDDSLTKSGEYVKGLIQRWETGE